MQPQSQALLATPGQHLLPHPQLQPLHALGCRGSLPRAECGPREPPCHSCGVVGFLTPLLLSLEPRPFGPALGGGSRSLLGRFATLHHLSWSAVRWRFPWSRHSGRRGRVSHHLLVRCAVSPLCFTCAVVCVVRAVQRSTPRIYWHRRLLRASCAALCRSPQRF